MQGTYHKDTYNSHKKQYREISQGYYMYTANAVAHDYQYEEEIQHSAQKTHRKSVKSRPVLAQTRARLGAVKEGRVEGSS